MSLAAAAALATAAPERLSFVFRVSGFLSPDQEVQIHVPTHRQILDPISTV